MKKPIVTYRRVASPKSSDSDERQRKALKGYLERTSAEAVEDFVDEGVSGITVDRLGLNALLRYCETHPGTVVLVESPVRVARNLRAYSEIVERLAARGAEIQFVLGQ